ECPDQRGITVRMRVEWVSESAWNPHHNHPSGDPEPSQADRLLTAKLKQALDLVGIRTLDHIVVGSEGCVSLAELGYL
ncbi:JAB domain-containing protein, partial [Pseudomonas aeruginosa]|uniref:JAB domain-containing protein n=1 Tax=Pseudomonas aeruginosa TaxID=287 RepID=UPI00298E29B5